VARTKYLFLRCNIQPGSGALPASCLMGTGILSKGWSVWDVIVTRQLRLQPRLRMSGTISLLPTCTGMLWTGINVVVLVIVFVVQ
jgi:hypothetical protein